MKEKPRGVMFHAARLSFTMLFTLYLFRFYFAVR